MENCHDKKSKQTTKMLCFLFIIHICLIPFSVHTVGYDKKINVSNISLYAVILEKSVPIALYIYAERADFST